VTYVQPKKLDDALGLLASEQWAILAGGTDFYPAALEQPAPPHVMDLHALDELRGITHTDEYIRIGAGVTWSEVIAEPLPAAFNALKLQQFILGNRQTARRPDEIVSAVLVPDSATHGISTFSKLGARKYLIISITMLAARLSVDENDLIQQAAVSVGSCSLVACRLPELEACLVGQPADADIAALVRQEHLACLAPISDVRSSAQYRLDASLELLKRMLQGMRSVAV